MQSSVINITNQQCRACLSEKGTMKNMYENKLYEDYYKITEIEVKRSEGITEMLCARCESFIQKCIKFKMQCLRSNLILQNSLKQKFRQDIKNILQPEQDKRSKDNIRYDGDIETLSIKPNQIRVIVCKNDINSPLNISCPNCNNKFSQIHDLTKHLKDHYDLTTIKINEEYYCPYVTCKYFIDSGNNKFFVKRKLLKQHIFKVHLPKEYTCSSCSQRFARLSDLNRHMKVCSEQYFCTICDLEFKVKTSYISHLRRKHPELYKQIKEKNKINILKRKENSQELKTVESKKLKSNFDVVFNNYDTSKNSEDFFFCDIETQTGFDNFLSIKPNTGDDDSLLYNVSDTQTQTWPIECNLKSNKETNTSLNTDSTMKETQTCACHSDSSPTFPKSYFDSSNFISTQTQTAEFSKLLNIKSDVMLSFSSAETQTCFENELEKNSF